jgi:hypothetical protein
MSEPELLSEIRRIGDTQGEKYEPAVLDDPGES